MAMEIIDGTTIVHLFIQMSSLEHVSWKIAAAFMASYISRCEKLYWFMPTTIKIFFYHNFFQV